MLEISGKVAEIFESGYLLGVTGRVGRITGRVEYRRETSYFQPTKKMTKVT